jgi:hypothetical protein
MKAIVFGIGSMILIYISAHHCGRARTGLSFLRVGMYSGLFLLNIGFWFQDPFAWYQLIAWALLFASLVPLAFGVSR